jgi:hypothetical protein
MKRKSHPQKNTLLKNAKANAASNFFKRVFFSPPQENFFPNLPFLINLFSQPHGLSRKPNMTALNINRFVDSVCKLDATHLRTDRRASANSGFKKLAVQWLNEHSTSHQHLCWLDSFVLRNRQLLKPTKR